MSFNAFKCFLGSINLICDLDLEHVKHFQEFSDAEQAS